jgi:hypothetical protein
MAQLLLKCSKKVSCPIRHRRHAQCRRLLKRSKRHQAQWLFLNTQVLQAGIIQFVYRTKKPKTEARMLHAAHRPPPPKHVKYLKKAARLSYFAQ